MFSKRLQLYQKEIPKQVFSREYCENFKIYFEEHLRTAAFVSFNLFVSNAPFLYPLKSSEKHKIC